ncbi:MAG: SulP family inorganic anion transporter [Isosphaeraceae bacterium]
MESLDVMAVGGAGRDAEKPRNGLAGLKFWRYDVTAGLMVSLTSLPFSLGIAVASGAPPIAGLMSAIIAGLIFPFLGGANVTIAGPAAGLAPALFAAMTVLGHGHLDRGYPLLLAVICVVGMVQVVLSLAGAAKLSAAFPAAVVEGMLAAIGLMIIAKEMPHFLGHEYKSHAFFGIMAETPAELGVMKPAVFSLGMFCLALLFVMSHPRLRARLQVPPPLIVVVVGAVLGRFLGLSGNDLIRIPDNVLEHGITAPNFRGLIADPTVWYAAAVAVVTLVLIDGVESLATIKAIDRIDPYRRTSDPDRTLLSMGVSNILSSLAGGLTIIPGGVKSKLCVVSGGKTLWANFYNALFLVAFLALGRGLINLIPYSALAAILIHTGYKMCEPAVWRHVAHVGKEQLALFSFTVLVTLATDLLVGIFAGMFLKLLLHLAYTRRHVWTRGGRPETLAEAAGRGFEHLAQLFRNPVTERYASPEGFHLVVDRPLVCFNALHLNRELERIPADASDVYLHIGGNVAMIDHTSLDGLLRFSEDFAEAGRGRVEVLGLDRLRKTSHADHGIRIAPAPGPANVLPS